MRLEKIITLANRKVLLRFLAMERSLRATGCQLPLWVIPFDDDTFPLPDNATWWRMPEILDWMQKERISSLFRRYQCLTEKNYQFVDSDVVFLRNPESVLAHKNGFITSCGHWHNPGHTLTPESRQILRSLSSTWQQRIFNSGQFACDRVLYEVDALKRQCFEPRYVGTCVEFRSADQAAINLLVNTSGVPIQNLTLPPTQMESTWAGDYLDDNYSEHWTPEEKKPYLIHWAGSNINFDRPINRLFLDYLTGPEREQYETEIAQRKKSLAKGRGSFRGLLRRLRKSARAFAVEWRE